MADMKQQLVHLGSQKPDLRPHIRPILSHFSNSRDRTAGVAQDIRKITQQANRHNMMVDLDTGMGTLTVTPEEPFTRRDRESFLNWLHSRYELEPIEDWGHGAVEYAYFD